MGANATTITIRTEPSLHRRFSEVTMAKQVQEYSDERLLPRQVTTKSFSALRRSCSSVEEVELEIEVR